MPDTENLNVAVVQTSLNENQGGLASFTAALCDQLATTEAKISLIARRESDPGSLILPEDGNVNKYFIGDQKNWRLLSFRDFGFYAALKDICRQNKIGIIHTQDLWTPEVHLAARAARELDLPYVMSITGTLTPWSLRHKRIKKILGWRLYQKNDLEQASVLHATCRREIEDIRRTGITAPVALIPLAVDIPRSGAHLHHPSTGERTVLYLSRIHRKKGLIHLVDAWDEIRPRNWKIIVAGQDDDGYRGELERRIRSLGLDRDFIFKGFVSREEKNELLRNADLFVLPTYSENFGLVIPEALSYGVPVITTRGTPWEDLNLFGCGWWIGIGTPPLIEALREALSLPASDLREMGQKGAELVREKYSFTRLGEQFISLYRWLRGEQDRPDWVYSD